MVYLHGSACQYISKTPLFFGAEHPRQGGFYEKGL